MANLAEEEADAAHLKEVAVMPEDARLPAWAGIYWRAWQDLRDDRYYDAYGGVAGIWFTSINDYASRHRIPDENFGEFLYFVRALDGEFLTIKAEEIKARAEAEKHKTRE